MFFLHINNTQSSLVHTANLNSGTDVALCEVQVVKDTDDVTNADFSRGICFCNNNFHIFATTESATLPVEQRTRAELLFYNTLCVRHTPTLH